METGIRNLNRHKDKDNDEREKRRIGNGRRDLQESATDVLRASEHLDLCTHSFGGDVHEMDVT